MSTVPEVPQAKMAAPRQETALLQALRTEAMLEMKHQIETERRERARIGLVDAALCAGLFGLTFGAAYGASRKLHIRGGRRA